MDKRKFNGGGSRKNAGRKKGGGLSGKIKSHVDKMMQDMLRDEVLKKQISSDLKQMSLTSGYIYVIKDLKTNFVKIGVTQRENPNTRLSLYTSHNIKIDLLHIDYVDNCFDLEDKLHKNIEDSCIKGDWFSLSNKQVFNIIREINKSKYSKYYKDRS